MEVIEQASKNKGALIETKFNDGSRVYAYATGSKTYYSAAKNGMCRIIHPTTAPKKCALMDKLAAAGIR